MLLMQDPKLLLLDEPVAGMTDDETARTGELFKSLAGKHSLVVVEHDMAFIEQLGGKVTVLHEGSVLAEGDLATVQNDQRVIEVYLGRSLPPTGGRLPPWGNRRRHHAESRKPQPVLRRQPHPARPLLRGADRQGDHAARPQRRRQDHAAQGA
jgi:ABC-type multidrug transport system ATPase subunit